MSEQVQCPFCLTTMPGSARFCPGCGRPRTHVQQRLVRMAGETGIPYNTLLERARQGLLGELDRPEEPDEPELPSRTGTVIAALAVAWLLVLPIWAAGGDALMGALVVTVAIVAYTRMQGRIDRVEQRQRAIEARVAHLSTATTLVPPVVRPEAVPPVVEAPRHVEPPTPAPEPSDVVLRGPFASVPLAAEPPTPGDEAIAPAPPNVEPEPELAPEPSLPIQPDPVRVGEKVRIPEQPPVAERPAAWWSGDLEELLSGRVLAWVGGLAILLGAVFFLSLAFSRGWIGPSARVAIGLGVSAAMIAGGAWFFERRERIFGHVLMAVGFGVSSLALLAGTSFYGLFAVEVALAWMFVTAVAAAIVAIRADSQVVAAYGLVSGLAAPPILGAEANLPTIGFLAAMLSGTTLIALYRTWSWLPSLAFLLAAPQLADWLVGDAPVSGGLVALGGFWLLNAIAAGGEEIRTRGVDQTLRPTSATLMLANAAFAVWGGFELLEGDLDGWRGAYLVALGLAHAATGAYFFTSDGERHPFGLLAAGTGLASLSIAVPVQLGGPVVPVAWAAEAAALAWVYGRRRHGYSAGAALVLLTGALTHLLAFEYPLPDLGGEDIAGQAFLNASGGTLAFILGSLLVGGWLVRVMAVRLALAVLDALILIYALPFELSGIELMTAFAVVFVAMFALDQRLDRVPGFRNRIVELPGQARHALAVPALLAGSLAIIHMLAWELPLDRIETWIQPETPFTDLQTLAIAILAAVSLVAAAVTPSRLLRRLGITGAFAFAAYLMPFELEPAPMIAAWSALAVGLVALASLDIDDDIVYGSVAMSLFAFGVLVALGTVARPSDLSTTPDGWPFWSDTALALGALAAVAATAFWLFREAPNAVYYEIASLALLAYLMPFELEPAGVIVAWSTLALVPLALPRWITVLAQQAAVSVVAMSNLLTAGAILALSTVAAPTLLFGDASAWPFMSETTVALASLAAVPAFAFWTYRTTPQAAVFESVALAMVAYLVALELEPASAVVGWSLLALVPILLRQRYPVLSERPAARIGTVIATSLLAAGTLLTLIAIAPPERLFVDARATLDHRPFLSAATLALAALAAALIAIWYLVREHRRASGLLVDAGALGVYLLSVGVVDIFQSQVDRPAEVDLLQKQAQVSLSILWAVLGVTAFIIGIVRSSTRAGHALRLSGLTLLGLATVKVFVYDLASLDASYRVLSFIGLGILLLASSWAYQHLMPRMKQWGEGRT